MEPIRVLQVATIMNRGGLETMLMNYYRKLDKDKIQFDFMVHREERGDYDDEIEAMGGKIYRMPSIRPGNYRKYFKKLDEFFKYHQEYKVVHSHINENSGFVLRSAKKANVPCRISHNHVAGLGFDYKWPFRMYARQVLKGTPTDLFACSEDAAKWLFGKNEVLNNNVKILNNAIDLDTFSFNKTIREKMREELKLDDELVIGHVGRFSPSKNHSFLIDVFKEIKLNKKDAVLLLVGEGSTSENIKKKVKDLNLDDSVKFLGLRSDIADLMNVMDIFVFPSHFEALPVVLVEAQAIGLKCVVSTGIPKEADITNSIEFIELKKSAKEWSDIILNLNIRNKDNTALLIKQGYDIKNNVSQLENLYKEKYK